MNSPILFERTIKNIENEYTKKIQNILNINTIHKWSKAKTIKFFNPEYEEWYLAYRFSVLRNWFEKNKNEYSEFLDVLIQYIDNLFLSDFLNAYEKNYIRDFKSTIFASNRNIKRLIIDFIPNLNEYAFFHYRDVTVSNVYINMINADLYLTNQRIVVLCKDEMVSFHYNQIESFLFTKQGFNIIYNSKPYFILTAKANTIKASLSRIYKIIKKNFVYE